MTGNAAGRHVSVPLCLVLILILVVGGACADDPTLAPGPGASPQPPDDAAGGSPRPIDGFEQGHAYWGVYVFVGDFADPSYRRSIRRLAGMGLERGRHFGDGQITCDHGAAEALDAPRDAAVVAAYFDEEDDARAFAAGLDPPPEGVARVQTFCAD